MKRFFDLFLSLLLIILFAPIILFLCSLIFIKMGRPIFFCQERPGLQAYKFTLIKFRTMRPINSQCPNSDGERLTRFGRFLRSTSLDELPELLNVIKGDMSLVGPRPLLCEYLDLYSSRQARRHEVRPGITGWAQINGRNTLSWHEKFELDLWYVENQNMLLDLRILSATFRKVLLREGISAIGEHTMPRFTGSNSLDEG